MKRELTLFAKDIKIKNPYGKVAALGVITAAFLAVSPQAFAVYSGKQPKAKNGIPTHKAESLQVHSTRHDGPRSNSK